MLVRRRHTRAGVEGLTRDMGLLHALLREPLSEDVRHRLGRECYVERELGVVPRHGRDVLRSHVVMKRAG